jgi:Ca2+/Na+ antiporter
MSTTDRLLLVFHIGFAIFTLGPVTAVTTATPRYLRRGNVGTVRFLNRSTRIYGLATLAVFGLGVALARAQFDRAWISASMTLFIVALVLLLVIERDQRKAMRKLTPEETTEEEDGETAAKEPPEPRELAKLEIGRISMLSGIVALIWIVILILMVWNSR